MSEAFEIPIIPNAPLESAEAEERFGLVSLRKNVELQLIENALFDENAIIYDDNYQNDQAVSFVFRNHMLNVIDILKRSFPQGSKLVEVGCGKGSFIELAEKQEWFDLRGFDATYEGRNPKIEKRFLNLDDKIDADIVVLRHVLEHIRQPHKFVAMLSNIFGDADIYIEVPDFDWIVDNQAFFDITYEHVNYFTPQALRNLFTQTLSDGRLFNCQYQYVIANFKQLATDYYSDVYVDGKWESLNFELLFDGFSQLTAELVKQSENKKIIVWGGATKGVLFCHHLQRLAPHMLQRIAGVVDINPKKQNRLLPSTHLPIISAEQFVSSADGNELVLVMNPNYETEISAFLQSNGQTSMSVLCV